MAADLRVSDRWLTEPRLIDLAVLTDAAGPADALGRLLFLTLWCLGRRSASAPRPIADGIMGAGGVAALVELGLADLDDRGRVVVAWARDELPGHLARLERQRAAGRGRARGAGRDVGRFTRGPARGSSPVAGGR
jgi:hypothetical protein